MAWYDEVWSTIKDIGAGVGEVVSTVAPILPFILKKGGSVKDFHDTPANRRKLVAAYNRAHKGKLTLAQLNKAMKMKGMKGKK
jgi:hypothetical protein